MAYDQNVDYQARIDAAAARGDTAAAAEAERSRNEKIAAMNAAGTNTGGYTATNKYVAAAPTQAAATTPVAAPTQAAVTTPAAASPVAAAPANYSGSTAATGAVSAAAQNIINQMNRNSKLWYSDSANKDTYAALNKTLAAQLAGLSEETDAGAVTYTPTYNAAAGTWSVTPQVAPLSDEQRLKKAAAAVNPISGVDTSGMENQLAQLTEAQKAQSVAGTDYATQQAVAELQRAQEDAQAQFQTERNQVSADEAKAKDNQALYAEMRGDKGGIGAAQYDAIQNTAAQNRFAVNQQQTKLATDTARQIADLRAQGEFEKADSLLEITQTYLSNLMSLEQWAVETNLSVEEFNAQLSQWQAEYELSVQQFDTDTELSTAQLTGQFSNGTTTLAAQNALDSALASAGETLLKMGIIPSDSQLKAMGMTTAQAQEYVTAAILAATAKGSGSGGGGGGDTEDTELSLQQKMQAAGVKTEYEAYSWLVSNGYKTAEIASEIAGGYEDWLANNSSSGAKTTERQWNIVSGLKTDWTKAGYNKSQIATRIEAQVTSGVLTEEAGEALYDYFGI